MSEKRARRIIATAPMNDGSLRAKCLVFFLYYQKPGPFLGRTQWPFSRPLARFPLQRLKKIFSDSEAFLLLARPWREIQHHGRFHRPTVSAHGPFSLLLTVLTADRLKA